MPTEQTATCPMGLSAEQLSTWRAEGLDPDEVAHLGAHVASCPACSATLASFDAMDRALRGQVVPEPSAQLWEALEPRLAYGSFGWRSVPQVIAVRTAVRSVLRERHGVQWSDETPLVAAETSRGVSLRVLSSPRLRVITTLTALAAVLLVVIGFASMLNRPATPAPAPLAIDWRQLSLPSEVATSFVQADATDASGPRVAPSDGNTMYSCVVPDSPITAPISISLPYLPPLVSVTHDRGAHWQDVSDLPPMRQDITVCSLVIDDTDPSVVLADFEWPVTDNRSPQDPTMAAFATTDGGKSWQSIADPQAVGFAQIVSARGIIYATTGWVSLFASRDGMQTWQQVSTPVPPNNGRTMQVWARPDSGELLASVTDHAKDASTLWLSDDSGQRWTQMTTPDERAFTVQQPLPGQPWRLCGMPYPGHNPSPTIECSWDSGKTWISYPTVDGATLSYLPSITQTGDVLAQIGDNGSSELWRLPVGGHTWQQFLLPASGTIALNYSAGPGPGVLWAYSMVFPTPNRRGTITAIYNANYPAD